ncbi:MAG: hypothetical protein LIO59_00315 [Oscillospiraceae bacterium]|nr:hypothetical protein [Clostridiales bacterium]MCC8168832.1 hypothetical protein [Oscillospiraceae bacterium]
MEYLVEIIIAVLAFAGTLFGSILANSKSQAVMQEQMKSVKEEINTLSARVDKHNNLVERMAVAENTLELQQHQIDELKADVKE